MTMTFQLHILIRKTVVGREGERGGGKGRGRERQREGEAESQNAEECGSNEEIFVLYFTIKTKSVFTEES